jgi:hypothetical protein
MEGVWFRLLMALQPEGKIVAVGETYADSEMRFYLYVILTFVMMIVVKRILLCFI